MKISGNRSPDNGQGDLTNHSEESRWLRIARAYHPGSPS